MILQALAEWPIDREASLLVGDKPSDLEAALRAGIRGVLFEGGDLAQFLRDEALLPD
jgi:D-glycero-D-manno-heptose 1,7-bisphosphate phosphatase